MEILRFGRGKGLEHSNDSLRGSAMFDKVQTRWVVSPSIAASGINNATTKTSGLHEVLDVTHTCLWIDEHKDMSTNMQETLRPCTPVILKHGLICWDKITATGCRSSKADVGIVPAQGFVPNQIRDGLDKGAYEVRSILTFKAYL